MISRIFDKIFHDVFFGIFVIITFIAICAIFGTNFFGVILAAVFLAISYAIFPKIHKKYSNISDKNLSIAFLIMLAIMLIVQFLLALAVRRTELYRPEAAALPVSTAPYFWRVSYRLPDGGV